jgi:hypothetical protein
MKDFLFDYQMNSTTWAYLSSLIIVSVYFKFRRFWSVRNLDLVALIAMAPGLLLVKYGLEKLSQAGAEEQASGQALEQMGYVWLFAVGGFFLVRLLLDPLMVRRPMLEPNLSAGGLTFTCAALLVFLLANVITPKLTVSEVNGAQRMDKLFARENLEDLKKVGPGYPLFMVFSEFSSTPAAPRPDDHTAPEEIERGNLRAVATRLTAILAYLALVAGVVLVGYRHFDSIQTGVAAASLCLLLPYTSIYTPRVDHVVPAALVVWAVQLYRRPVIAGMLLGLAGGLVYFPLYLIPLWCAFYWRRGLVRFSLGVGLVLLALTASLLLTSGSLDSFMIQFRQMFGIRFPLRADWLGGFWKCHEPVFRLPVLAAFVAVCGSLVLWPAQKNLGTLLSCSAAVLLGAQFWKPHEGGLFMAWYLPLLVLTIFRPNLEDRVALSAVSEARVRWRRSGA